MVYTQRIEWETLREVDSSTLTGGWDLIGDPLENPSFILKMVNTSDEDVLVSIDGTNAIDVCPAGSFWLYDETKSRMPDLQFVPKNTQFYIQGTAGTGSIYLVSQYLKQLTGQV